MTTRLGIDGVATVGVLAPDGCCVPPLCNLDPCALVCNFVQALPTGPLWDRPKAETISRYHAIAGIGSCAPVPCPSSCATIVDHAVYTALRLYDGLLGALHPAIREASPYTAHDTLDEWLARLGWRDCYDCACRDGAVAGLSPIEIWGPIANSDGLCEGPICCPQEYSLDLQCAVKRGTVIALHRLSLMPRRTVAAINFVLAPLGAALEPVCYRDIPLDPRYCNEDDGTTLCAPESAPEPACEIEPTPDPWRCPSPDDDCQGQDTLGPKCVLTMKQYTFRVCPTGDTLPKCPLIDCRTGTAQQTWDTIIAAPIGGPTVQAWYEPTPCGEGTLPAQVWPGIMAAECIARTALPRGSKISLIRC